MDTDFVRTRITRLRMDKGVSEYQMSLDLGMSKGYIQSISSGKALPSLAVFRLVKEGQAAPARVDALDEATMKRHHITFKKIPRDITLL